MRLRWLPWMTTVCCAACSGADTQLKTLIVVATIVVTAGCGGAPFSGVPGGADGSAGVGDAGEAGTSTGPTDATPDPAMASDAGADASTGDASGSPGVLRCGPTSCAANDTCCVYVGTASHYECRSACPPPPNGEHLSALKCAGAADCSLGMSCCIEQVGNDNQSACALACTPNQAQLCDPLAAMSGCAATAACSNKNIADWNLPGTYATCGGV